MKIKPSRRRLWIWWVIAGAVLALALGSITWLYYHPRGSEQASEQTQPVAAKPVSLETNALFFGNTYWGRYINDWSMASPLGVAYPFSRLSEFQRESYNTWIAGLECPTVAGFSQTSAQEDATLSFNCNPDYLPEAAKWFTAFTLANNHTDNRGPEGFEETKRHLEANGIQYFGHYDPYLADDVCDVMAFPVTVAYNDQTTKEQYLPIAMCGYHGVFKIPSEESLQQIAKYAAIMPVIAMPHMGVEYQPAPDRLKTQIYRSMIDYGADMVLGDHPHWIQNSEAYNGKLIVYSMGNFMFDQQDSVEVTRSAGIRVVASLNNLDSDNLAKWLAVGEQCKAYHDDCFAQATALGLPKLSLNYAFGVVGTNDGQKIVKPATEQQQASILQRLNWQQTMNQLQPPQRSL